MIYIYLNNHLRVKVRWDFNKKSTPSPIYFNNKSTTRLLSQKSSFLNLSLILDTFLKLLIESCWKTCWQLTTSSKLAWLCKSLLGITQRNLEQLGKLKLSKQLAKKKKKEEKKVNITWIDWLRSWHWTLMR